MNGRRNRQVLSQPITSSNGFYLKLPLSKKFRLATPYSPFSTLFTCLPLPISPASLYRSSLIVVGIFPANRIQQRDLHGGRLPSFASDVYTSRFEPVSGSSAAGVGVCPAFPQPASRLGSPISSPDQRLSLPDLGRYQDRLNRRHGGKEKTQKDDLIMSDPAVLPPTPKNRLGQTEKKVGVIDRPRLINHN